MRLKRPWGHPGIEIERHNKNLNDLWKEASFFPLIVTCQCLNGIDGHELTNEKIQVKCLKTSNLHKPKT